MADWMDRQVACRRGSGGGTGLGTERVPMESPLGHTVPEHRGGKKVGRDYSWEKNLKRKWHIIDVEGTRWPPCLRTRQWERGPVAEGGGSQGGAGAGEGGTKGGGLRESSIRLFKLEANNWIMKLIEMCTVGEIGGS